ncbi:MAG: hypothetical protein WAW88_01005 [Nocardioides sp.]
METLIEGLAGIHMLVAVAIVVGYVIHRMRGADLTVMVWSARAQLLLGIVLVGLIEAGTDEPLNHTKIGVKLLVAVGVVACAEIANARAKRGQSQPALVDAAAVLTFVNILVAFLWS